LFYAVLRLDIIPWGATYEEKDQSWYNFVKLFAFLGDKQAKQIVKTLQPKRPPVLGRPDQKAALTSSWLLHNIGVHAVIVMGIGGANGLIPLCYEADEARRLVDLLWLALNSSTVDRFRKSVIFSETVNTDDPPELVEAREQVIEALRVGLNEANTIAVTCRGNARTAVDVVENRRWMATAWLFAGIADLLSACLASWSENVSTALAALTEFRQTYYNLPVQPEFNQTTASMALRESMRQAVVPWAPDGIVPV